MPGACRHCPTCWKGTKHCPAGFGVRAMPVVIDTETFERGLVAQAAIDKAREELWKGLKK